MKYIVLVPDGVADYPISELGGKTPLEVARTTNMDFLAQNGFTGLVQTIPPKMKPGSDIGNLALLGYDPKKYYFGRAPLEAANLDIRLADDEVAFRCNLVTVEAGRMIDYSAGHIPTKEASELISALSKEIRQSNSKFYVGKSYRHLLVLKTMRKNDFLKIQCTAPHDILDKEIKEFLPRGKESEVLLSLMEQSKNILNNHPENQVRIDLKENPANMIWLWGQGARPQLPSFMEKFGVQGSVISAVDLVNGIGKLIGLQVISVPGATGYYDTNFKGKAEYALNSLADKDFVFVHVEATDEAGHNGDYKMKIQCIERFDRDVVGTVLDYFNRYDDVRILVCPDHVTPVEKRTHTAEAVPFVMFGKGIQKDEAENYSEATGKKQGLKFKSGEAMMEHFMRRYL
ncbi:MAG: cofactor-independent phosphoglycerate mutase [Candidatus Omnitrophota bacterium]